jgi:hypothetical protein
MTSSWGRVAAGVLTALLFFLAAGPGARPATAQDAPAGLVEKKVKSLGKVLPVVRKPFLLSPSGDRMAYLAGGWKDPTVQIVCDGKESQPYWEIVHRFRFSPDGKRFGFMGRHVGQRDSGVFVCDGVESPVDRAWSIAFSSDSKHVAYIGPGNALMLDGKMVKTGGVCWEPVFSPDGRHLACRMSSGAKAYALCDGAKDQGFDEVHNIVFCPNSTGLAYTASEGEAQFVIWSGGKLGPYKETGAPVFSPDGNCLAFKACLNKWFVVHKGKKGPDFDAVGDPVFSIGGGRLAYAAVQGKASWVICDGKKGPEYAQVSQPVFALEGRHLAYFATREGKTFAVCDGKESEDYREITWIGFPPDNKHLVFTGGNDGKRSIVCDGLAGPIHEDVLVPEHFYDVPGTLRYVVIDKAAVGEEGEAWLVEVDWPADRTWEDTFKTKAP